jgi:hypothetical protein
MASKKWSKVRSFGERAQKAPLVHTQALAVSEFWPTRSNQNWKHPKSNRHLPRLAVVPFWQLGGGRNSVVALFSIGLVTKFLEQFGKFLGSIQDQTTFLNFESL